MRFQSLSSRLTIWNALILAGLVGALGFAEMATTQGNLRAHIDEELTRMAEDAARFGPMRGPGGPGEVLRRLRGERGGPPFGPGGPNRPPPVFREAFRVADLRRPRFFRADGLPFGGHEEVSLDPEGLKLALAGQRVLRDVRTVNGPARIISMPVQRRDRGMDAPPELANEAMRPAVVQFARETGELERLAAAQLRTLLAVLPLGVVFAALGGRWLTRRTLQPVAKMTADASAISGSDLQRRLEVSGDDELAQLGQTFNGLLARLETSFRELERANSELRQAFERERRFTSDASHELRTPLTRLRLATSRALDRSTSPEEMREALLRAHADAEAMSRLVQQLLTLARSDAGQLAPQFSRLDLRAVVADALSELPAPEDPRLAPRFAARPVTVSGDADMLRRVALNLVENSLRHTPADGRVEIEVVDGPSGRARLTVRDNGSGIPAEHLSHVFDRFYRVDAARTRAEGGHGLGLAIVKQIVEAHRGAVRLESRSGEGTTAMVELPSAETFDRPHESLTQRP